MSFNGVMDYSTQSQGHLLSGSTAVVQVLEANPNRTGALFQYFGTTVNHCYLGYSSSLLNSTDAAMVCVDLHDPVELKYFQGSVFAYACSSGMLYVNETIL